MNVHKKNKWWLEAWKYKSPAQLAKEYVESMTLEEIKGELIYTEEQFIENDVTRYQEEIERSIESHGKYEVCLILENIEARELGFYDKWENRYTLIIDFVKHEKTIKEMITMETKNFHVEQQLTQMYAKDLEQMDLPELSRLATMLDSFIKNKEAKMQWLSSDDIFQEVFHITHEEYQATWNEVYDEDYTIAWDKESELYINIQQALSNAPFDIAHLEDKEWKNKGAGIIEVQKTSSLHEYIVTLYQKRFFEKHAELFFQAVYGFSDYYKKNHKHSTLLEHVKNHGKPLPEKSFFDS